MRTSVAAAKMAFTYLLLCGSANAQLVKPSDMYRKQMEQELEKMFESAAYCMESSSEWIFTKANTRDEAASALVKVCGGGFTAAYSWGKAIGLIGNDAPSPGDAALATAKEVIELKLGPEKK